MATRTRFQRFYRFLPGETDLWYPDLTYDNHSVSPPGLPEDGYHLSKDLADRAIEFIGDSHDAAPDKPFFLCYAPGCGHAPHHIFKEEADKYEGKFDMGWDEYRDTVFANQKKLGLFEDDAQLSPSDPDVPDWDTLSDDEKKLYTRMMEVYAGFHTYTDAQFGRILDFLEGIDELDNTLIMFISDNGASPEGGDVGSLNEYDFFNFKPQDLENNLAQGAGAKSQMVNIIIAAVVLLTVIALAPLFQWLPEAVLGAVVISVMLESADPRRIAALWNVDRIDFAMATITAFVVLYVELLPAMVVGIVLSIAYMVYRVSFPGRAVLAREPVSGDFVVNRWMYGRREGGANPHTEPVEGVIVFRFSAPLIFSNADAFTATGEALLIEAAAEGRFPHTLVVDFEGVFLLDVTGAESVTKLAEYARRYDVDIRLARVHTHAHRRLEMAGVVDEIGEDHIHRRVQEAVEAATAADN